MTVLHVGKDAILLKARAGVLASAGLVPVSSCSIRQALEHIKTGSFAAAILCHSLDAAERAALAAAFRANNPCAPVLLVGEDRFGHGFEDAADCVDAVLGSDPARLVAKLRRMLPLPSGVADRDMAENRIRMPRSAGNAVQGPRG